MKAIILFVALLMTPLVSWSGEQRSNTQGQPFQELQEQIAQLDRSTRASVAILVQRVEELEAYKNQADQRIAALEAQLANEAAARLAMDLWLQNATYEERDGRMTADADILIQLDALELPANLVALADLVEVVPGNINGLSGPHIVFEGANVHVRSGSGATNDGGYLTGLGNLIIGYNEAREYATKTALDAMMGILAENCLFPVQDPWDFGSQSGPGTTVPGCYTNPMVQQSRRVGSHNLIVGDYHNFNSYGGVIAGIFNATDEHAMGASVLGGSFNLVTHPLAMIVGGSGNRAQAHASTILGGRLNKTVTFGYGHSSKPIPPWPIDAWGATEAWSSIVAGRSNLVASMEGAIVGGLSNSIKYTNTSVIVGGHGNYITTIGGQSIGDDVVILGGRHMTATDGAQVQPLQSSMEALTVALMPGAQGCSDGTIQFLDIASNMPGLGGLFGWLGSGCSIW